MRFKVTFIVSLVRVLYKVVRIGDQVWMAENLRTGTGNDGTLITVRCDTSVDPDFYARYGGLYTWEDAKKACPDGWRLPSKSDFDELIAFAGNTKEKASANLRSLSWSQGTDRYGFEALPAGLWYDDDEGFLEFDVRANFWSSTEHANGQTAYLMTLSSDGVVVGTLEKSIAASVRCIKDN